MSITALFYLLAFICFLLGFVRAKWPPVDWMCGGFMFLTLSLFVG